MSEAIEKAANFSPAQLFLLSALTGASGFGGMRLLTDLSHQVSPPKPFNNSIKLQLPDPYKVDKDHNKLQEASMSSPEPSVGSDNGGMPKQATGGEYPSTDSSWLQKSLGIGIGLPVGFLGAKSIYDGIQGHEYNLKIEQAKKQYANQLVLAQAMNKQASHTPKVDELCQSMADEFEKTGGLMTYLAEHGGKGADAVKSGINSSKDLWSSVKKPLSAVAGVGAIGTAGATILSPGFRQHIGNSIDSGLTSAGQLAMGDVGKSPIVHDGPMTGQRMPVSHSPENIAASTSAVEDNAISSAKHTFNNTFGGVPGATGDALKALLGVSGIGMLGMLIHNHSKKKEREQKAQYPTSIEYAK